MVDIFSEVDEDLRRDRATKLWKAYGRYVIAAAVLAVVATGAWQAWSEWQRREAAAETRRLLAAVDLAQHEQAGGARAAFGAIVRDGRPGARAIARLFEAGFKVRAGDFPGAFADYRAVAADGSVDRELRDAAQMMSAMISVQTLSPADIDALVGRLADAASPWRFSALEVGALAALGAGQPARAKELYARVADDAAAPASLRARAAEMLQAIGG